MQKELCAFNNEKIEWGGSSDEFMCRDENSDNNLWPVSYFLRPSEKKISLYKYTVRAIKSTAAPI